MSRQSRKFLTGCCSFSNFPFSLRGYLFIFGLLILVSCSGRSQEASPASLAKAFSDAGLPLLRTSITPRDFSLQLAAQETSKDTVSLKDLRGKVVFLNFWATWCGPCRVEMPSMEALYNEYKERGLEILAVNIQETPEQVNAFMKENGLSFTAALDRDGRVSGSYGIQAIPTSFIIDRDGKIIARLVGSIDWNTQKIRSAMDLLLK